MNFTDNAGDALGKEIRLPKKAEKVKNKAAAPLQITAEQLLREAKERELEVLPPPPRVRITDPEELAQFNRKKRKEFEDGIRKNRMQIANWVKYAKFEENIGEMQRARSVFERSLDVDHRSITLWLQYAEMEMRNRQVNHARNIWDRAVTILPRATQFWLKYSYMEELVENIPGARQVFERWMEWEPDEQAWFTYINFELRYKEVDRARQIHQRFLHIHGHRVANWVRYAKFEERHGNAANARAVYERSIDYFGVDEGDEGKGTVATTDGAGGKTSSLDENLLIAFAQFEERQKEYERARTIYQYGLDHLPAERAQELLKGLTLHEKKYGERVRIESAIVTKRRHQYEEQVRENPFNYDAWFDYIRLLLNEQMDRAEVEECFEKAIANVPPYMEKRFWRRYVWLWIYYAVYEELDMDDVAKARDVWRACLDIIPHKRFTFARVWIMFSQLELRQLDLSAARKVLGVALGKCPKRKLFNAYIEMELQLREFDRCRRLYEKQLEFAPDNSMTWIKYAELETLLGDEERARSILQMAVRQGALDMPEVLWKSYIDFEIDQGEHERVRILYESLLQRTQHIKVWLSWAEFELSIGEVRRARELYSRANTALEAGASQEERLLLLEQWRDFESGAHGDEESRQAVERLMPKRVKRRRQITADDGTDAGWEEYFDYIFPQDASLQRNFRLLEAARLWRQKQLAEQQGEGSDEEGDDGHDGGAGENSGDDEDGREYGARAASDY